MYFLNHVSCFWSTFLTHFGCCDKLDDGLFTHSSWMLFHLKFWFNTTDCTSGLLRELFPAVWQFDTAAFCFWIVHKHWLYVERRPCKAPQVKPIIDSKIPATSRLFIRELKSSYCRGLLPVFTQVKFNKLESPRNLNACEASWGLLIGWRASRLSWDLRWNLEARRLSVEQNITSVSPWTCRERVLEVFGVI